MKKMYICFIIISFIIIISSIIINIMLKKNVVGLDELLKVCDYICCALCLLSVVTIVICLIKIKHLK